MNHAALNPSIVIPAQAGIQGPEVAAVALDPRFRGGDDFLSEEFSSLRR
jgi:hypothetical protein